MPSSYIPDADHVVRYVPWSKLRKDEDDNIVGIVGAAFRLREGEDYLSSTWLEYFTGSEQARITACVHVIRASNLKPGKKSAFAIGNVTAIKGVCTNRGRKLRIIHEAEDDNAAHVAIRNWPADDDDLCDLMAEDEHWGRHILNSSIP